MRRCAAPSGTAKRWLNGKNAAHQKAQGRTHGTRCARTHGRTKCPHHGITEEPRYSRAAADRPSERGAITREIPAALAFDVRPKSASRKRTSFGVDERDGRCVLPEYHVALDRTTPTHLLSSATKQNRFLHEFLSWVSRNC